MNPKTVAAGNGQTAEKSVTPKPDESSSPPATGTEDFFKGTPTLIAQQTPQKDVKGDIMSLFEKVNSEVNYMLFSYLLLCWVCLSIDSQCSNFPFRIVIKPTSYIYRMTGASNTKPRCCVLSPPTLFFV